MADMDKNIFDWLFVRSYERRDTLRPTPSWKRAAKVVETTLISYNLIGLSFVMLTFIIVWKVTINRRLKAKKLIHDQRKQIPTGKPKGLEKVSSKITSDSCKSRILQSPHGSTRQQAYPTSKLRSETTGDDRRPISDKKVSVGRIPTLGDQILNKGRFERDEKPKRDATGGLHPARYMQKHGDVHHSARNTTLSTKGQQQGGKSKVEVSRPIVSKTETTDRVKIDKFNEVTCLRAEDVQDQLTFSKEKKTVISRTEFPVPKIQATRVKTEPETRRKETGPVKVPTTVQMIKKEEAEVQEPTCSKKCVHNGGKVGHQVPLASCEKTNWDKTGSVLSGWRLEKSVHLSLTTDTSVVTADDAGNDLMTGDFGSIPSKYVSCQEKTHIGQLDATAKMKKNDQAEWPLSPVSTGFNDEQRINATRTEIHNFAKGWTHCQQPSPDKINVRKRSSSTGLQGRKLGSDLANRPINPRLVHSSVTLQLNSEQIGLVPEENIKTDKANVKRTRFERLQILAPMAEGSQKQSDGKEVRKDASSKHLHEDDETMQGQKSPHHQVVPCTGKERTNATQENQVSVPVMMKKKEMVNIKRRSPNKRKIVAKIVGRLKVRKHRPKEMRKGVSQIKEPLKGDSVGPSITRKEVIVEKLQSHPQNAMTKYFQVNGSIQKPKSPFFSSSAASMINKKNKKEPLVDSSKALFFRSSSFLSKSDLHDDNCFVSPDSKKRTMSPISVAKLDAEPKTTMGGLKAIKPDAANWQEPEEEVSKLKQSNLSSHLGLALVQMLPPVSNTKPDLNIETEQKKMEKPCKRFDDSEFNRKVQLKGLEEMTSQNLHQHMNLARPPTEREPPQAVPQEHLRMNHSFVKDSLQEGTNDDVLHNTGWSRKRLDAERKYPCDRARSKARQKTFVPPDTENKDVYTSFAHQPDSQQRQTTGHNVNGFTALKSQECQNLESLDFRDMPLTMASGDNFKADKNGPKDSGTGYICHEKEIGPYHYKTIESRDLAKAKEDSVFRYEKLKFKTVVDPWTPGGYPLLSPAGHDNLANESFTEYQKFKNPIIPDAKNKERGFLDTREVAQRNCSMLGFAIDHTHSSSKGPKNEFSFPNLVQRSRQFTEENQTKQPPKNGAAVKDMDQLRAFLGGPRDLLPSSFTSFQKSGKSSKHVEKVRRRDLKGWSPATSGHSVDEKKLKHACNQKMFSGDDGYRVHPTVVSQTYTSKRNICPDLATRKRRVNLNGKIPDHRYDRAKSQAHEERGFRPIRRQYLSKPAINDQHVQNFDRDDTDTSKSKLLPKRSDIKSSEMTLRKISSPSVTGESKKTKAKSKIPRYVSRRVKRCIQTQAIGLNNPKREESRRKNQKLNTEAVYRSSSDENKNKQTHTPDNFGNLALGHSQLKKNTQRAAVKVREKKHKIYRLSESSEEQADIDRIKIMKPNSKTRNRMITNSKHFKLSSSNSSQDVSDATSLFKNNLEESIFMVKPKRQPTLRLQKGVRSGSRVVSLGKKDTRPTSPTIQSHLEKITKYIIRINEKKASKRTQQEANHFQKVRHKKLALPCYVDDEENDYRNACQQESSAKTTVWSGSPSSVIEMKRGKVKQRPLEKLHSLSVASISSGDNWDRSLLPESKTGNKFTLKGSRGKRSATEKDDGNEIVKRQKSFLNDDDSLEVDKKYDSKRKQEIKINGKNFGNIQQNFEKLSEKMWTYNPEGSYENESDINIPDVNKAKIKTKRQLWDSVLNRVKVSRERKMKQAHIQSESKDKHDANTIKKGVADDIMHENDRDPMTRQDLKTKFETDQKEQQRKILFSTKQDLESSEESSVSDRAEIVSAPRGVLTGLSNVKKKVPYHVINFEDFSSSLLTVPGICRNTTKPTQERVDNKRHQERHLVQVSSSKSHSDTSLNETPVPNLVTSPLVDTKLENINLTEKTCPKHKLVSTQEEKTVTPMKKNKSFRAPEKRVVQRPPKSPTLSPDPAKVGMKPRYQQVCLSPTRQNSISRESGDVPKHPTKKDEGKKEFNSLGSGHPNEQVNERQFTAVKNFDRQSKGNKSQLLRDMTKDQSHTRFTQRSPHVLEKDKTTFTHFARSKKASTEVNKKIHDVSDVFRPGDVSSPPPTVSNSPRPGFHRPAKSSEKRPLNSSLSNIKRGQRLITEHINRQRNEKLESAKNKSTCKRQEFSSNTQENVKSQKKSNFPIHREVKTLQSPKEATRKLTGRSPPSSREETMKVGSEDFKQGIQRKPFGIMKTKALSKTKCRSGKTIWQISHPAPPGPRNKALETDGAADGILNEDTPHKRLNSDNNRTSTPAARLGTRSKQMNAKENPTTSTGLSHSSRPEQRSFQKKCNEESVEKLQVNRPNNATMQQKGLTHLPNQETLPRWRRAGKAETENDRQQKYLTVMEEEDLGLPDHLPCKIRSNTDEISSGSLQRLSPKNKRIGSPRQTKLTSGQFSSTSSPSNICTKKARVCEYPTNVDALREKYLKEMKAKQSHVDIQFTWNSDRPGKQYFQKLESKPVETRAERQRSGVPKTLVFQSKTHENKAQKLPVKDKTLKTTGKEQQLSGLKRPTNDSTRSFLTNNDVSHATFKETPTAKYLRREVVGKDTQITVAQCPSNTPLLTRKSPSLGSITQVNSLAAASQNTAATYTQRYRSAAEMRNSTYSVVERNFRNRRSPSQVRLLSHASHQVGSKIRDVGKPTTDLQIVEHFDSLLKSTSSHPKQTTGTYTITKYPSTQCIFSPGGGIDSSTGTGSWAYRTSANLADSYSQDSVELGNARSYDITRGLLKYMDKNSGAESDMIKEEFRHSHLDSKFISGARPTHGPPKITTQGRNDATTLNECILNEMSRPKNRQDSNKITGSFFSKDSVSEHTSDEDLVSWLGHSDTQDKEHDQEPSPATVFTHSSTFKGTTSDISPLRTIWGFQGDPEAMTMPAEPRRMSLPSLEEMDEYEHKQNQPRITRISKRLVKRKALAENSQETVGSSKTEIHKDKRQKESLDSGTSLSKSDLENNVTGNFREQGSSTVCLDRNVDLQNGPSYAARQTGNGDQVLNVFNAKSVNKCSSQKMDLEKKQVEITGKNSGHTQEAVPRKINMRINTDRKLYVTSALRYNRKKQQGQSNKPQTSPLGINNSANLKTVDRFHSRSHFRTKPIINNPDRNNMNKLSTTRNLSLESTKAYFKTQQFSTAAMVTENTNRHLLSPSSSARLRTLDAREESTPLSSSYLQENNGACFSRGNGSTSKSQSTYPEQSTFNSRTYMASEGRIPSQDGSSQMGRASESQHEADHNHRHRDTQDDAADEKSEEVTTTTVPTMTQLNFDWYKPAFTTNRLTNENRQTITEQPMTAAGGQSNRAVRREINEGIGLQSSGRVGGYFRGAVGGQMEDGSSGYFYNVTNGQLCNRTLRPPTFFRDETDSSQLPVQGRGNSVSVISSPFTFTGRGRRQRPPVGNEVPRLSRPPGNSLNELPSTDPRPLDLPRPDMTEHEEINQRVPNCSRVRYEDILSRDASDPRTFTVAPNLRLHDTTFLRYQNPDSNSQSQTFNLNISNASSEYLNLQRNYNRANQLFHSNWLLANQNHSLNAHTTGSIGHRHSSTGSDLLRHNEGCPQGQVHNRGNFIALHRLNDASRVLAGQHLRYLSVEQHQPPFSTYSTTPHGEDTTSEPQSAGQLQVNSNSALSYQQAISDVGELNHNRLVFQNGTLSLDNSFLSRNTMTENEAPIALERPPLQENQIVQRRQFCMCERNIPGCSCLRLRNEESNVVQHSGLGPGTPQDPPMVRGGPDDQTLLVRQMFGMFEQSHQRQRHGRFD